MLYLRRCPSLRQGQQVQSRAPRPNCSSTALLRFQQCTCVGALKASAAVQVSLLAASCVGSSISVEQLAASSLAFCSASTSSVADQFQSERGCWQDSGAGQGSRPASSMGIFLQCRIERVASTLTGLDWKMYDLGNVLGLGGSRCLQHPLICALGLDAVSVFLGTQSFGVDRIDLQRAAGDRLPPAAERRCMRYFRALASSRWRRSSVEFAQHVFFPSVPGTRPRSAASAQPWWLSGRR